MDAASFFRASAVLEQRGARCLAKAVKALAYFLFKSSIPPQLKVGRNFRVGHRGTGIVIHERTVIGNDVFLHHNVTLATDIDPGDPRRMQIGDAVMIGTGSIVVGPVRIGDNVVVGAGSVVVDDVPNNVLVVGVPARVMKTLEPGQRPRWL